MIATITKIKGSKNQHEMKTPNLGLECAMIFQDSNGNNYYLLEDSEYFKIDGRKAPGGYWFDYGAQSGTSCEIEFEDFSGDKIITDLRPVAKK